MNHSNSYETHDESTETTGTLASRVADQFEESADTNTGNSFVSYSGMDIDVFIAAREGNIDCLREHGEHLHQMLTPSKNTVLHIYIACVGRATLAKSETVRKSKPAKIVEEIVQMCPPLLLQPNGNGDTPLHFSARHGHAAIVEVLIQASKLACHHSSDLERGISTEETCWQMLIRTTNKEKNTALHEAVRFNHLDVVRMLTTEDPDFFYSANDSGETPVYMATERGYRALVIEMLKNCTNPTYQGPNGYTSLHAAAISNDEQMTKTLLVNNKALTRAVDELGDTPLHLATCWGHAAIVKQLLQCDKSAAYICDNRNRSPFHNACYQGNISVVKELASRCPDCCEFVDNKGRNGLHYAIDGKSHQVEAFIRNDPWLSSVLLNGKDADGNTPLHYIATSLYEGMDFISEPRVDKMTFNKRNLNALDILQNSNELSEKVVLHSELTQQLIKTGARGHCRLRIHQDGEKEFMVNEVKEANLVVSTLIATVTFAAGFAVPGGYQSEKGPDQGFAVLTRNAAFKTFVMANTLAMCMSSCAVMIRIVLAIRRKDEEHGPLIRRKEEHGPLLTAINLTFYALIAMVVAFLTGTYSVLGYSPELAIAACVTGCFFSFVFGFFMLSRKMDNLRIHYFNAHDTVMIWLRMYKM
ncbi:PREDICTED: ankyrin repeat-containing protein At3g12360-like [Fragaria vesca subsp. vesca]|uniref:ankyrin repeat-containing protein At3g12360-like n=1 Tax=Fragaria vesca subsp. vesca TaxID=101020 RepID=UPI0002C30364|nr:PREDICTED: ankyrin repeat-containing protein At3g12360-like [Fragaria vesca subsp. vesca]